MSAVYLAQLVRVTDPDDPSSSRLVVNVPAGTPYVTMMAHVPSLTAVVATPDDDLTRKSGLYLLLVGTSWENVRTESRKQTITNRLRRDVNGWCVQYGFEPLPPEVTLMKDAVEFVCRQVNPGLNLDQVFVY